MECFALGICTFFWSSAYVLASGCVLGLGTIILGRDSSLLYHSMFLSVCPGGFSAITDVCADYLTRFYNTIAIDQRMESTTKLMAFFDTNRDHPEAHHLLYMEFPEWYV